VISRPLGRAEESDAPPADAPPDAPPAVAQPKTPTTTAPAAAPATKDNRPPSADPFDPELFNQRKY
jgi:hypothetical protein